MSDLSLRASAGGGGDGGGGGAFRARTAMLLVVLGVIGFVGMLVLGAYAPDFRPQRSGGGHALSNAAIGFSGIARLAEATGRNPAILRDDRALDDADLLVATPDHGWIDVSKVLGQRRGSPTLFVLPKWQVAADPKHAGWVRRQGLLPRWDPEQVLAPGIRIKVSRHPSGGAPLVVAPGMPDDWRFTAPRPLQVLRQDGTAALRPLLTDGRGGIVVAEVEGRSIYLLADPDLLDNRGLADAGNARAALAMLDWMNVGNAQGINFDVTLNGFGHSRSPLRLAFEPPFLAATLAIGVALLLAGAHALGRFGSPRPRERALAFGKRALVDNAAALIRKAGREGRMGDRYAGVLRERARARFGVPARLAGPAVDAYLDRLPGRAPFTRLAAAAAEAQDPRTLLDAARALHQWQERETQA
jgi:hypothetical protein